MIVYAPTVEVVRIRQFVRGVDVVRLNIDLLCDYPPLSIYDGEKGEQNAVTTRNKGLANNSTWWQRSPSVP